MHQRLFAKVKQAGREQKARDQEFQRFENHHKAHYARENQQQQMRLKGNQTKVRRYNWKKRN